MVKSLKSYIQYLKLRLKEEYQFFNLLARTTGVDFKQYLNLKFKNDVNNISLFGKRIKAPDSFWHLHSLNEIFIDEIYRFKAKNKTPFILDCGSNIGLSIIYFKRLYPGSKIIGFEPDPSIFQMLQNNLKQFNFTNVELKNNAVWIEDRELSFNAIGALGGSLNFSESGESHNQTVSVKALRLKDFLTKKKVDFLKIDVEGAEFELLNDCVDTFDNVENIFIEYHRKKGGSELLGQFIDKLEKSGFKIYIKEAWNNLPNPYCHDNFHPMYDLQLNIFGYRN